VIVAATIGRAALRARNRLTVYCHTGEHYAAVAYSSCEVFELHHLIWYVSAALIILGIGAIIYDAMMGVEG